jgi:hypothetical protein
MRQSFNFRSRGRRGVGLLIVFAACCASLRDASAERITRGARCTGDLHGVALHGAIQLEHLAEPEWETISGNFRGRGTRLRFEAQIHNGAGTGRMWDLGKPNRSAHIELTLHQGGFALRWAQDVHAVFACEGPTFPQSS